MRITTTLFGFPLLALLALSTLSACGKGAASPNDTSSSSSSDSTGPAEPPKPVATGRIAPDFTTTASDGTPVHLAALKGKPVVVYFYPKDETPGCTREACSFRDAWEDLAKTGVVLIGVSNDSDASHKKFAEHYHLPFLLVSDADGAIGRLYGVPIEDGMTARQTFVIAADGTVKKIYRDVHVGGHAKEVLADINR